MGAKPKKKPKTKASRRAALGWIGIWATLWWGISCAYVLLLVWAGKDTYVSLSGKTGQGGSLSRWHAAIRSTYHNSAVLPALLGIIIVVWLVGSWFWLREVKRQNIGYKAAFKDLFLTIR